MCVQIYLRRLGSRGDHLPRGKEKRALATVREMVRDMEIVMGSEEETRVIRVEGKEEAIVSGLDFYSNYELSITAFNSKGEGPRSSPTHFITPEGGETKRINIREQPAIMIKQ